MNSWKMGANEVTERPPRSSRKGDSFEHTNIFNSALHLDVDLN